MSGPVLIAGEGLAACCCARLLQRAGLPFVLESSTRPRVPVILASPATAHLLDDIFGETAILNGFHNICRRVVAWGALPEAVSLPHAASVVSEQTLLDRLWDLTQPVAQPAAAPSWTLVATRGSRGLPEELKWGSRIASVTTARLRNGVQADACWVEAVRDGWLFLMATGNNAASMISVGLPAAQLLEQSWLVSAQIDDVAPATAEFPAYPRILAELTGPGWLACGSAAMTFDPVCGEGAGNAAREAILACAVVRAILEGEPPDAALAHYRGRLLGGFLRHLEISLEFYTKARQGPWWDGEIAHLEQGIAWARAQMRNLPTPQYRLVDFQLQRIH